MGLTVLLDAQIDDYALTSSFFHGFKVTHFTKPLVEILLRSSKIISLFTLESIANFHHRRIKNNPKIIQVLIHHPEDQPDPSTKGFAGKTSLIHS
jgi:hypothetical protein